MLVWLDRLESACRLRLLRKKRRFVGAGSPTRGHRNIEQPQVELRAFALAEPEAERFFAAFDVDSDHDVERLLDDPPFVSHFEEERIQVEDRPDCL